MCKILAVVNIRLSPSHIKTLVLLTEAITSGTGRLKTISRLLDSKPDLKFPMLRCKQDRC
jgi:hypothetical protein